MNPKDKSSYLLDKFGSKELAILWIDETIDFVTPSRLNSHKLFLAGYIKELPKECNFDYQLGTQWTFLEYLLEVREELEKVLL
jgi:hypothetical protein